MGTILEVVQGELEQSSNESHPYQITTTPWASSPTVGTVTVYDLTTGDTDVTSTVMPAGSHTDSGDVITLKPFTALTAGHKYRIEVQFASASSTWDLEIIVKCPR